MKTLATGVSRFGLGYLRIIAMHHGVRCHRAADPYFPGPQRPGMGSVAPYVAAKHGVIGLTRAVALESAAQGVRVNALVSGAVDTPAFRGSMGATPEGEAAVAALHPLGRISRPDEIASLCAYLLSDEASFVTGAAPAIDGGFTAQ